MSAELILEQLRACIREQDKRICELHEQLQERREAYNRLWDEHIQLKESKDVD